MPDTFGETPDQSLSNTRLFRSEAGMTETRYVTSGRLSHHVECALKGTKQSDGCSAAMVRSPGL